MPTGWPHFLPPKRNAREHFSTPLYSSSLFPIITHLQQFRKHAFSRGDKEEDRRVLRRGRRRGGGTARDTDSDCGPRAPLLFASAIFYLGTLKKWGQKWSLAWFFFRALGWSAGVFWRENHESVLLCTFLTAILAGWFKFSLSKLARTIIIFLENLRI